MIDISRERLVREVRAVRRHRQKPEHWSYRVYQAVMNDRRCGHVGAYAETDFVPLPEYPTFSRRLMHPQEVADLRGGKWLPYYAARFPD